ncbi:MAG: class I SAM-dependent methyltransferase [Phototrophicaceae bacterium]
MPPGRRPPKNKSGPRRQPGGWDAVAAWYDGWVGRDGSHHHQRLAIPALLRLLDARPGQQILDVGCGQGVLAPHISQTGAPHTGADVSQRLLDYARQHHGQHGRFIQADAARLHRSDIIEEASFDAVVFLLSLQDMNPLDEVIHAADWALKPGGRVVMLLTHPAFRIPRQSGWGFDESRKLRYRRVDRYLTELPVPMKQHPGKPSGVTISFHRPISAYVNLLGTRGLLIDRMEEIPVGDASLKKNRPKAEKLADDEIPLFLALRARKR